MTAPYPMKLSLDHVSLFFDMDTALYPTRCMSETVEPDAVRNFRLRDIALRLDGRVAAISRRTLSEVDRILTAQLNCTAGCFGLQRRDARLDLVSAVKHPKLDHAVSELRSLARDVEGMVIEARPLSASFQWNPHGDKSAETAKLIQDLARRNDISVYQREGMAELLSQEMDIGRPLRAFMVEPPFFGTIPIFVGGGTVDEEGFRAVSALGGFGVRVGDVPTIAARFHLDGVDAIFTWLTRALADDFLHLDNCISEVQT